MERETHEGCAVVKQRPHADALAGAIVGVPYWVALVKCAPK